MLPVRNAGPSAQTVPLHGVAWFPCTTVVGRGCRMAVIGLTAGRPVVSSAV
jgi:hypothetical protein